MHSWDGIETKGKCWNCSAEGHMKPDCPYGTKKGTNPTPKVAKTVVKPDGKRGNPRRTSGDAAGGTTSSSSATPGTLPPTSPTTTVREDPKSKTVIIEEVGGGEPTNLMGDLSGLVRSLHSMKMIQLRFAAADGIQEECDEDGQWQGKVALVDGGATHALRQGSKHELKNATPVQVDLAHGATTLYRKANCSTLLTPDPIEPIVPMRVLINRGYSVSWTSRGCVITHPARGPLKTWRRQGCPVMREDDALALLAELEQWEEKGENPEVLHYWKLRYPQVPDEVFKFMKGQGEDWREQPGVLPFNRHRRRQLETAKGIVLHLFAGTSRKSWDSLRSAGWEVVSLDLAANAAEDLHGPALWSYLWMLGSRGLIKIILGGPPCRSTSRLRHRAPGPRPLRGRGEARWALEGLTASELNMVHGDTALVFKLIGLFDHMKEHAKPGEPLGFLMEHPEDPLDYIDVKANPEAASYPSVWEWPEVQEFSQRHGLRQISFDQGATGHQRRKPTRLLTDLPGMEALHGLRHKGPVEGLKEELGDRLRQSSSWAAWSPGLCAAIKEAIPQLRKMTMADWKAHVEANHVPFRRDCRLCLQEMGQDLPHRRKLSGGDAAYVLSVDIAGPFHKGWDYGDAKEAKYALIATVPIPIGMMEPVEDDAPLPSAPLPAGDVLHPDHSGDPARFEDELLAELQELSKAAPGSGEVPRAEAADGSGEVPRADAAGDSGEVRRAEAADGSGEVPGSAAAAPSGEADDGPVLDSGEVDSREWSAEEKRTGERLNAKWKAEKEKKEAEEPIKVQGISMMEPIASRSTKDVLEALNRVYSRYRALGVPMLRFHSDRAKEFISRSVRDWVACRGMWQTATSGDDPPGNGRIESEISQWKRRVRLTLKAANAPVAEWPSVGRHAMEERCRRQLAKVGVKMPTMVTYNQKVMIKAKWWHKKEGHSFPSPYLQAVVKGPSPLMHNGWVVRDLKGKTGHARAVLIADANADRAMLELVVGPPGPGHRLHGKQPLPGPRVPSPQLVASAEAADPNVDLDYEPSLAPSPAELAEDHGDAVAPLPAVPMNDDDDGDEDAAYSEFGLDSADAWVEEGVLWGEPVEARALKCSLGGVPKQGFGGESLTFQPTSRSTLQDGLTSSSCTVDGLTSSSCTVDGLTSSLCTLTSPSTWLTPSSQVGLTPTSCTLPGSTTLGTPTPCQKSSTSGGSAEGGVMAEFPWEGSLEDYEEWLSGVHRGWTQAMEERVKEVPMTILIDPISLNLLLELNLLKNSDLHFTPGLNLLLTVRVNLLQV